MCCSTQATVAACNILADQHSAFHFHNFNLSYMYMYVIVNFYYVNLISTI